MHILFLLTQDLESPSGAGRYFPLAQGLARLGHRVSIAALHADIDSLQETRLQHGGVEVHYVAQMHVRKLDNRKIYFPAHRLLFLAARATWALSRAALSIPADVVHIGKPHPMNSLAGLLARRLRGATLFLDCDDYEAAINRTSGAWQRQGIAFFENRVPLRAAQVTTHNSFLRQRLLKLGVPEERITYLPNGVDLERFRPPDPQRLERLRHELGLAGLKTAAFVGSLSSPGHPVDLLLDAFQEVHRQQLDSVLLIVGGGEEFDRLKHRARSLGLEAAVRFTGRIPAAEVPAYYRLADVLVDPVNDDEVGRSRMPLKMFESWASEVPFVTADVGDRRLVMGDPPAGLLVPPGEPGALAQALLDVFRNGELADGLRQRGLERVRLYSWDRLAQLMEADYLRVQALSQAGKVLTP